MWSNGDTYEGEWLEGFAHGLGMYTYSNGDAFEGEFKQDKFHGHGAFSSAQNVKYRGCWDHGDLMGWTLVVGKNGEKFKQYFDKGVPVATPVRLNVSHTSCIVACLVLCVFCISRSQHSQRVEMNDEIENCRVYPRTYMAAPCLQWAKW